MANECLVTEYKDSVNNDALFGLNEIKIKSSATTTGYKVIIGASSAGPVELTIYGDAYFSDNGSSNNGKTKTVPAGSSAYETYLKANQAATPCYIGIKNRSNLTCLRFNAYKTNFVSPMSGLQFTGALTQLYLNSTDKNDVLDLAVINADSKETMTVLKTVSYLKNISALSDYTALMQLTLSGVHLDGDVELSDILDAMHANGRDSGSLLITCYDVVGGAFRVNGVAITSQRTISFTSGGWS